MLALVAGVHLVGLIFGARICAGAGPVRLTQTIPHPAVQLQSARVLPNGPVAAGERFAVEATTNQPVSNAVLRVQVYSADAMQGDRFFDPHQRR